MTFGDLSSIDGKPSTDYNVKHRQYVDELENTEQFCRFSDKIAPQSVGIFRISIPINSLQLLLRFSARPPNGSRLNPKSTVTPSNHNLHQKQ